MTHHFTERKGKRILIPTADQLAAAVSSLPAGEVSSLAAVRNALAAETGADQCCPVTVQRLLVQFSESGDVPYWRVVDAEKPFAKRLAGGADRVRQMQAGEQAEQHISYTCEGMGRIPEDTD